MSSPVSVRGSPKKPFNATGYAPAVSMMRHLPRRKRKGHGRWLPVALIVVGVPRAACPWHPSSRYGADAPGRAGSARVISPSDSTRDVIVVIGPEYTRRFAKSSRARPPPTGHGLGSEHERLDGLEVLTHRLLGRRVVALLDGVEYPAMILVRALRAAGRVERLLAALRQQVHGGVDHAHDRAVVRGGGDRRVKLPVLADPGASGGDLPRLGFEDAIHVLDFVGRRAAGGESGDGGLQQAASLEQLGHGLALGEHHERERLDQRVHGHLADERALTGANLDQPDALERAQGFPHRCAAHHELLGEIALGGEAIAALEAALADHALDLADDLLVDPRGLDGLDGHLAAGFERRIPAVGAHEPDSGTCDRLSRDNHQPIAVTTRPITIGTGYCSR